MGVTLNSILAKFGGKTFLIQHLPGLLILLVAKYVNFIFLKMRQHRSGLKSV